MNFLLPLMKTLLNFTLMLILSIVIIVLSNSHSQAKGNHYSSDNDLFYHLPSKNVLTLSIDIPQRGIQKNEDQVGETGESESNSDKNTHQLHIPIIRYEARQPLIKGFAIIIGEQQIGQKVDANMMYLADTLPDHGWHTIFINPTDRWLALLEDDSLANIDDKALESEDNNTDIPQKDNIASDNDNSADSISNEPLQQTGLQPFMQQPPQHIYSKGQYQQALKLVLNKLETDFLQQPGYRLIISSGMSAFNIINIMNDIEPFSANGLVITNPYWPSYEANNTLPESLSSLTIPILDIVSTSDNNWSTKTSSPRKIAARVNMLAFYRQRELVNSGQDTLRFNHIKNELIGWTKYLGW